MNAGHKRVKRGLRGRGQWTPFAMAGLHPWVGGCAFYVAFILGLLQSVRAAFEWLLSTADSTR